MHMIAPEAFIPLPLGAFEGLLSCVHAEVLKMQVRWWLRRVILDTGQWPMFSYVGEIRDWQDVCNSRIAQ